VFMSYTLGHTAKLHAYVTLTTCQEHPTFGSALPVNPNTSVE